MTPRIGRVTASGPDRRSFDAAADRLVLAERRQETADIVTFAFRTESGGRFRFLPGQAITLKLPVEGDVLHRTFTIASPPTRDDLIELTVKAGPQARGTRWMHERLAVGDRLSAIGPVGRFSLANHYAPRLLLASAGSGITPMMAMLRWLADRGETTDVVFLHQARSPADIPFRPELDRLAQAMPNLRIALAASSADDGFAGHRGRIDRAALARLVPDTAGCEAFCCGPAGFMAALRDAFIAEGGASERFHTEAFHPEPPPGDAAGAAATLRYGERSFQSEPGETLLATLTRNGVTLPTGCRSGVCGTCRVRISEGAVDMRHNGGLTAREERAGYALACCSRPRGDVAFAAAR